MGVINYTRLLGVLVVLVVVHTLLVAFGLLGGVSRCSSHALFGFEGNCKWGNREHPSFDSEKTKREHEVFCRAQQHHLDIKKQFPRRCKPSQTVKPKYNAAPAERAWMKRRHSAVGQLCETAKDVNELVEGSISATKVHEAKQQTGEAVGNCDECDQHLSSWTTIFDCDDTESTVVEKNYIEPLVGNARNPEALCIDGAYDEERHLLFNTDHMIRASYSSVRASGKAFFFDLGSSWFDDSIKLFAERYHAQGIAFDEVYAWEAHKVDASE
jgi:hypothetical protein